MMNNSLEILLNGQQFKKLYEKTFHPILHKYGLTKLEIEILLFFEDNQEYDTAKDIVDLKFFAKSHVSTAISSLVSNGYLISKSDELDRRCVHLKISNDAKEVVKEAKELRRDFIEILFKEVSSEEKRVMTGVAKKIANNIREALETDE